MIRGEFRYLLSCLSCLSYKVFPLTLPNQKCNQNNANSLALLVRHTKKGGESISSSIGYCFDPDGKIEFSAINVSDFQERDCSHYSFICEYT